jgi:hypothetical protein
MSQVRYPRRVVIADDRDRVPGGRGGDVRLFKNTPFDAAMEAAGSGNTIPISISAAGQASRFQRRLVHCEYNGLISGSPRPINRVRPVGARNPRQRPPAAGSIALEAWRENLLLDSARSASSIARGSGIEGSLFELELDLYRAVRLLARRYSRVRESE